MYILVSRRSGKAIAEVNLRTARSVNPQHFEVLPTQQWLYRYNHLVRQNGGFEPTNQQFFEAMGPKPKE